MIFSKEQKAKSVIDKLRDSNLSEDAKKKILSFSKEDKAKLHDQGFHERELA